MLGHIPLDVLDHMKLFFFHLNFLFQKKKKSCQPEPHVVNGWGWGLNSVTPFCEIKLQTLDAVYVGHCHVTKSSSCLHESLA
jgi:hypothetical protein